MEVKIKRSVKTTIKEYKKHIIAVIVIIVFLFGIWQYWMLSKQGTLTYNGYRFKYSTMRVVPQSIMFIKRINLTSNKDNKTNTSSDTTTTSIMSNVKETSSTTGNVQMKTATTSSSQHIVTASTNMAVDEHHRQNIYYVVATKNHLLLTNGNFEVIGYKTIDNLLYVDIYQQYVITLEKVGNNVLFNVYQIREQPTKIYDTIVERETVQQYLQSLQSYKIFIPNDLTPGMHAIQMPYTVDKKFTFTIGAISNTKNQVKAALFGRDGAIVSGNDIIFFTIENDNVKFTRTESLPFNILANRIDFVNGRVAVYAYTQDDIGGNNKRKNMYSTEHVNYYKLWTLTATKTYKMTVSLDDIIFYAKNGEFAYWKLINGSIYYISPTGKNEEKCDVSDIIAKSNNIQMEEQILEGNSRFVIFTFTYYDKQTYELKENLVIYDSLQNKRFVFDIKPVKVHIIGYDNSILYLKIGEALFQFDASTGYITGLTPPLYVPMTDIQYNYQLFAPYIEPPGVFYTDAMNIKAAKLYTTTTNVFSVLSNVYPDVFAKLDQTKLQKAIADKGEHLYIYDIREQKQGAMYAYSIGVTDVKYGLTVVLPEYLSTGQIQISKILVVTPFNILISSNKRIDEFGNDNTSVFYYFALDWNSKMPLSFTGNAIYIDKQYLLSFSTGKFLVWQINDGKLPSLLSAGSLATTTDLIGKMGGEETKIFNVPILDVALLDGQQHLYIFIGYKSWIDLHIFDKTNKYTYQGSKTIKDSRLVKDINKYPYLIMPNGKLYKFVIVHPSDKTQKQNQNTEYVSGQDIGIKIHLKYYGKRFLLTKDALFADIAIYPLLPYTKPDDPVIKKLDIADIIVLSQSVESAPVKLITPLSNAAIVDVTTKQSRFLGIVGLYRPMKYPYMDFVYIGSNDALIFASKDGLIIENDKKDLIRLYTIETYQEKRMPIEKQKKQVQSTKQQ